MANWDDLRVFLAVARAESLSAAAPSLKMDPATVSRRITRLEGDLGASLFVKSPLGYALTDLGARMLTRAAEAEEALSLALEEGQGTAAGMTGQIRIGAPDGCANYLLPQVCAAMQKENPELEIQILALPRVVNLSKREADLAITVSPPTTGRMTVQKITDYRLHLATHLDRAPEIRSVADLREHPIVGYIPDMIFDRELDYIDALDDGAVARARLASNSVAVQAQLLRTGQGIGIVHDFALPFVPELRRILTQEVSLTRSFYMVRHVSDRKSARLTRFAGALSARLKVEVARLESLVA